MEWLLAHWAHLAFGILVADKVASSTPPDFKIGPIPIGKWDNQIVDLIKWTASAIRGTPKK